VKDKDERTPLHFAVNVDSCDRFIKHGDDVNAEDRWQQTPLHSVARTRHPEICEYLIQRGVDINAKNDDGRTALHLAARNGGLGVVGELVKSWGADVNAKTGRECTALHLAAYNGHVDVVRYLIENNIFGVTTLLNPALIASNIE